MKRIPQPPNPDNASTRRAARRADVAKKVEEIMLTLAAKGIAVRDAANAWRLTKEGLAWREALIERIRRGPQ